MKANSPKWEKVKLLILRKTEMEIRLNDLLAYENCDLKELWYIRYESTHFFPECIQLVDIT